MCCQNFAETCKRVATLKSLPEWNSKTNSDRIVLKKVVEPCVLPEIEIVIMTVWASLLECLVVLCQRIILFTVST